MRQGLPKKFFDATMKFEGGYCNVKGDSGGETYKGIARNFHPNWKGWAIVDAFNKKRQLKYNETIKQEELDRLVHEFYEENFFFGPGFDKFPEDLAGQLFDCGVNCGTVKAKKILQDALSVEQDGIIGKKTLAAVQLANIEELIGLFKICRAKYYQNIVGKNPSQSKFLKGWLTRAKNYPNL